MDATQTIFHLYGSPELGFRSLDSLIEFYSDSMTLSDMKDETTSVSLSEFEGEIR